MVESAKHDLFALFEFALREHDWLLADLMAPALLRSEPSGLRLQDRLSVAAKRPGSPGSLETLHRWAQLARALELQGCPD